MGLLSWLKGLFRKKKIEILFLDTGDQIEDIEKNIEKALKRFNLKVFRVSEGGNFTALAIGTNNMTKEDGELEYEKHVEE